MSTATPIESGAATETDPPGFRGLIPKRVPRELLWSSGAFLLFAGAALAAYWPTYPGDSTRIPTCACGDPSFQTWLLGWIPYAVEHGRNPFFSGWMNYPVGVNLAQNTDMPLLGALAAPITRTLGPVAAFNFLMWLAFPVSAFAMYEVVRRLTNRRFAAFCSGLLYGFSAYVVGQGIGHVMLSFVPLPPIFLYFLYKITVRQSGNPYWHGLVLGVVAAAQFFISSEILASMIVIGAIGVLLYLVHSRRSLDRTSVGYLLRAGSVGALALSLILAFPIYMVVAGAQHFREPVRSVNNPYHDVGLGPILPTLAQHYGFPGLSKYGTSSDPVESGDYLGIPLLALTILISVWFRRNKLILFSATMAFISYVLSLGLHFSWRHLGGTLPLPFELFARVPLINNLLPERLSLYQDLFVAVIVGLGISELAQATSPRSEDPGTPLAWAISRRRILLSVVLSGSAIVTLIPRWPITSKAASVPSFFRSGMVNQIPSATNVLTYPFPNYPVNEAMTWQAEAGMRFKLMGGYAFFRSTGGDNRATTVPAQLPPVSVEEYLAAEELAPGVVPRPSESRSELVRDLRTYVESYQVRTVLVGISDPTVRNIPTVVSIFREAFGRPLQEGGVLVWFRGSKATSGSATPDNQS